jgi:hypothetical protein
VNRAKEMSVREESFQLAIPVVLIAETDRFANPQARGRSLDRRSRTFRKFTGHAAGRTRILTLLS